MTHESGGVSKDRAKAVASERFPPELYECVVYEELPEHYSPYWWQKQPQADSWYVVVNKKHTMRVGGSATVLCISKQSGHIVAEGDVAFE